MLIWASSINLSPIVPSGRFSWAEGLVFHCVPRTLREVGTPPGSTWFMFIFILFVVIATVELYWKRCTHAVILIAFGSGHLFKQPRKGPWPNLLQLHFLLLESHFGDVIIYPSSPFQIWWILISRRGGSRTAATSKVELFVIIAASSR